MPFLSKIKLLPSEDAGYVRNIRSLYKGFTLNLRTNVTFFVGENGSGKSTLLEGIAEKCGFSLRGGNRNHNLNTEHRFAGYEAPLTDLIKLTWTPHRITNGFFMRAESFFNFASYLDDLAVEDARVLNAYGGRSLHAQSHGESFLALFNNQFDSGIYILDEPEAALSPARILTFMSIINNLERNGNAQFLIATHSPMLVCYPGAAIYHLENEEIRETTCEETEQFNLTKNFLNNPDLFLRHLIE